MKIYKEIASKNTENQDNYILDVWGDFDSFREDIKTGSIINLPVDCIVPRSAIEFDNAEEFGSMTNGIIELSYEKINCDEESRKAELVIHDGHNRYKTAIAKGMKTLKCIVK